MSNNTEFKVESGIQIPPVVRKPYKYPFAEMEVGQSFFVKNAGRASSVIRCASKYGREHSMKFATRVVTEGGVKGTRVWRIA